jgi:serine/threonine-protein kinase
MGSVVLARREDDFEKPVALKRVHTRLSDDLIRRFHRERQILAQLEHPNIARILDGGTDGDGRPYFAMELVPGEPIDRYCEIHGLGLRPRLELVLHVCSALALAHRNLVVHRDIKPSNILVTADGVPKLLDFGIAKRLETADEETELTRHQERPMTLRYASPEQITGGPITTASDVYGLGVLLYLLLTGGHPLARDGDSDLELAEAIREREPRRPSAAVADPRRRRELEGDLDAIVHKALRKEPEQRYGSVAELAEDLGRHLAGRPVHARQGTWLYVAGRFVRRHRLALVAALAVMLLILVFGITANLLRQRAEVARRQAETARQQAVDDKRMKEEALELLREILRGAGPNRTRGEERTALELVREAEERLEGEDPLVQAELLTTIGQVYTSWGFLAEAGAAAERAVELLAARYPEGHPDLAVALNNLAAWHYRRGAYDAAVELYRKALAVKARFPDDGEVDVAKSLSNLATALWKSGREEGVEALYLEALERRRKAAEPDPEDLGQSLRSLGAFYHQRGDLEAAEDLMRQAVEVFRQAWGGEEHTRLATAWNGLGRVLHDQGRYGDALELYRRALESRLRLLGDDHLHVAASRLDLARLYRDLDRPQAGRVFLAAARDWLERQPNDQHQLYRARADSLLGAFLAAEGHWAEAEPHLLTGYRQLAAGGQGDLYALRARRRLADLYTAWGRPERLAEVLGEAQ